jgi:GH15 family glucan-1,4-alpha-glucosidase
VLEESSVAWFMLAGGEVENIHPDKLVARASDFYHDTVSFWQQWIEQSTYKGRRRELINRSVITLKLLTSHRYGSVVAAPTFSLPEVIGGTCNWDYRFTWIRDGAFTMYVFLRLGFHKEAAAFLEWIRTQCMHRQLQLMYAVDENTKLTEIVLPHLEGYKGSGPVRIGNAAHQQFQLDIYGELLDTVYLFNKEGGAITYEFWQEIEQQVAFVINNWQEPDHGIWEIRNDKQEFLHSRLMAWVAIDRAIKIARMRPFPYPEDSWRSTRDAIFKSIYTEFWDEDLKSFVQFKGSKSVDASVLLMPLMRFITSTEPHWLQTLKTIDENLRLDVLIYRYNNALEKVDGLEFVF